MTNIFVGNLDITVTEQQLREVFAAHTGEPRGMAFVEMSQATEAEAAIATLEWTMLNGRAMRVNEARPKIHREQTREAGSREHRRHRT